MEACYAKAEYRLCIRVGLESLSFTFPVNGKRQGRNVLTEFSCNLYVLDFLSLSCNFGLQ